MAQEENTPKTSEFLPNNVPLDLLKHLNLIFSTLKIWAANVQVMYFVMYFLIEFRDQGRKDSIIDRFFEGKGRVLEN